MNVTTRRLPIALAALGLMLTLIFVFVPVKTDMSVFFPRGESVATRLLAGELLSGTTSRIVLAGIRGPDTDTVVTTSRALHAALATDPQFVSLQNGTADLSEAEREFLLRYRYLFSPQWTADAFTVDGLRAALEARVQQLRSMLAPLARQTLAIDPLDQFLPTLQRWAPSGGPESSDGVWISADGNTALLVAQLNAAASDLDGQERALTALRDAFARLSPPETVTLQLTGPPVFAVASRATIRNEIAWLSTATTALVTVILWWAFRSLVAALIAALPLFVGIAAGTAVTALVFGSVHGITLAFGATILGVAIDYPLHVLAHLNARETPVATARRLWPTLWLLCLTTAIGYGAMTASSFAGLAQLGVFAIAGLLSSVLATRYWLPHLVPLPAPAPAVPAWIDRYDVSPRWRAWHVTALVLLVGVSVVAAFTRSAWWSDDIQRINTVNAEQRAGDAQLRAALGAPSVRHLITVAAPDAETALQHSEKILSRLEPLLRDGQLGGVDAIAHGLPSIATQRARQNLLPGADAVRAPLAQAVAGFPFRADTFAPFLDDLAASAQLAPARPEDIPPGSLRLRVDSLLRATATGALALLQLKEPVDAARVQSALAELKLDGATYVDLQLATGTLLHDYRVEALQWVAAGGAMLLLLLAIMLRSIPRALISATPALLAVTTTASLLHLAGVPLTLFHVVSLLLVAGLALDYALFFFRHDPEPDAHRQTLFSVLLCALTTTAVFAALALSSVTLLAMMGTTVTLGVTLALIATLALAPRARAAV